MTATATPPRLSPPAQTQPRHRRPPRLRGLLVGSAEDARWVRPALIALLVCTAIAYGWDLSASGDANSFYAAAVQAGTKSWKAFFFGSVDSSNFITVDKIPGSLWIMELSGRIFGFSSWSMLLPEVLEGLAAVSLLYAAVKRWFGAEAGLLAGTLLAITPVAALMFRFNNPDALLVCLLVGAAYCLVRALERASTRWMVAVGTLVGFAFLAKMAQALLVVPAFALVYLVAAPTSLRRRVSQVLAGAVAIVVSAGWWVAIVALWPASSRPMIDGSSDNSILNLIIGYNGLGRIFGASGPSGGGGGASFSGATGPLRLFNDLMGGQASWLLPAALLGLVVGLWNTRRAPRTDRTRAALLLWGGWLIVSGLVFSFGSGVIHTYYTVALAPAIAGLVAIAAVSLWRARGSQSVRLIMALSVGVTTIWSWVLLNRTPGWEPWLRWLIVAAGLLAVIGLLTVAGKHHLGRRAGRALAVLTAVACLAGPLAYTAQTVSTAHTGSVPSAGPSATTSGLGGGAGIRTAATLGAAKGGSAAKSGSTTRLSGSTSRISVKGLTSALGAGGGAQSQVSSALIKALQANSGHYRWVAAVSGSESAASLELATGGDPVMAIGGFSNEGGNITLQQFKQYVARGEIHYYIASTMGGTAPSQASGSGGQPSSSQSPSSTKSALPGGGSSGAKRGATSGVMGDSHISAITSWVKAHHKSVTIGGQTVYDLTQTK
jgi:4-amino-4-deoxy-L-arabinose transferase-like glycosyltransferase